MSLAATESAAEPFGNPFQVACGGVVRAPYGSFPIRRFMRLSSRSSFVVRSGVSSVSRWEDLSLLSHTAIDEHARKYSTMEYWKIQEAIRVQNNY